MKKEYVPPSSRKISNYTKNFFFLKGTDYSGGTSCVPREVKKINARAANVIPETLVQKRETWLLCFCARSTILNGCIDPLKSTVL